MQGCHWYLLFEAQAEDSLCNLFFFFLLVWLDWVFIALWGLSLVSVSGTALCCGVRTYSGGSSCCGAPALGAKLQ